MKIKTLTGLIVLFSLLTISACNKGFKTTDDGLQYKYLVESDSGEIAGEGGYIKMHVQMKTEKDSIIDNTFATPDKPAELMVSPPTYPGCIYGGFAMLKAGDSVMFKVLADSLYQRSFNMQMPGFIKSGEHVTIIVKVLESRNKEGMAAKQAEEQKKQAMAAQKQLEDDTKLLKEYAEKQGYTAKLETTQSGLMYVKLKTTNGATAKQGEEVSMFYKGSLLNGSVFDQNIGKEPLRSTIGQGGLISGWLEVLDKIKVGEKWLLLIPSGMAYGPEEKRGPDGSVSIPANSPLIFEMELTKIRTAAQVQAEEAAKAKKLQAEEKQKISSFLKKKNFKNIRKEVVDSSEFHFVIEKDGTGANPRIGDTAIMKIRAFDLDGNPIMALTRQDPPFPLLIQEGLWPALKSSMLKMKKGTTLRLITPSGLFQGSMESRDWKAYTPLMLEMEMVDIKKGK